MDTLTATLAAAVAERIDYRLLARYIAEEIQTIPTHTPAPHPDTPIEVAAIRAQLGRRGRPMSHAAFNRNYIDTGLLTPIPGPSRSKIYVRAGDWHRISNQIEK